MSIELSGVFNDGDSNVRSKIFGMYGVLIGLNLFAWAWALLVFHGNAAMLGSCLLAYSFGLRHAFDADHIAAIDNVTRKMMQEGKRPISVGFFFSLGHSMVVILLAIGIAITAAAIQSHFDQLKDVGGIVGTVVSALFLFAIAGANILVLIGVWRSFQHVKRGGKMADEDLDMLLANRGLLARLFKRLFRLVEYSWQMFPLGFLFGLGFDTATEVGLLGISAAEAAKGVSIWSILVFPVLFTAGMSLVDSTDGVVMTGAYGWAFVKPIRKLYYNLTITFVSVVVAVVIGGIEALGLIGDQFNSMAGFWDGIGSLNDNFGTLGYAIVALFIVSWIVSALIYRFKRYDDIEANA